MRIALVHSFYRSENPSGENAVVLRQVRALQDAGHQVLLVARHTDEESKRRLHGLRSGIDVATGTGSDPTLELRGFGPDVVHVHNLFPNFGERWLERWGGPIVATLHNFRAVCANALMFRNGATCTKCVGGNSWPAIRHSCYRDSRTATLPLAIHNAGGMSRNRLIRRADRIIVLSERSRLVFSEAGGVRVARKLVVIHNGIEDCGRGGRPTPRHWAFIGRLSPEKGIRELIDSWPESEFLRVAGDGPLFDELHTLGRPGVELLGAISPGDVDELLRHSWGLVLPSRWMEGFPTVVAEASRLAIPVVARAGNSGADFVLSTGAGVVYDDEARLPDALASVRGDAGAGSARSRRAFEQSLSLDTWTERLMAVYGEAIESRPHAANASRWE